MEAPDPSPRPGHVIVRTSFSVISPGTEQSIARTASRSLVGKAMERPDQARKVVEKVVSDGVGPALAAVNARLDDLLTPGYSLAGVVEDAGGVPGLAPGDAVACVGANVACHAERVLVPGPLCTKLPAGLDARAGAFAALGAIASHGLRTAAVEPGHVVAVVGMGLIGQIAGQLAASWGARVLAVDSDPERVALALELIPQAAGAVPGRDDVGAAARALSAGAGADAVVVAAAAKGSGPIELAAEVARDRAVVSVIGDVGLEVPRRPFYEKELQLRLSRSYGPGRYDPEYELEGRDYPIGYVRWTQRRLIAHFLEEVAAGRVRLDRLVSHEFALERGEEAYAALEEPGRMAILLRHADGPLPPVESVPIAAPRRQGSGRVRIGLVGPGLFARSTLLPLLDKLDADVAAVAGGSGPRAIGAARRAGARAATTTSRLIDDPGIDAVVIATRHDSHAPLAVGALEAGKAVFLEKPLAVDEAGLEAVTAALLVPGRLMVDFNRSLSPAAAKVRAHFAGRVDPLVVHCRVNAGALPPEHWLRDPAVGGGRLVGEGCHFVDLCSAIVERPLAAVAVTPLGSGPTTLAHDSFVLTLTYADGSLGIVTYVATGSPRMAKERIEVLGAGRSAVIDDFRRVQLHGGRGRAAPAVALSKDKGHRAALERFLAFAGTGGEPPIPYERLLETTRATLIARAALAGEPGRAHAVNA